MPLREWFRPPRHLLTVLLLLTAASVSAVVWLGWKITQQESAVEAQRSRDRLEQAADRIVALLRASLAETGESLAAAAASSHTLATAPPQSVLLLLGPDGLSASPPGRLLYMPVADRRNDARDDVFDAGEAAEIGRQQLDAAAELYRRLSQAPDPARQAGALMRLARVRRKQGQLDEARAVYQRLARLEGVRVAGVPADLVARHALCDLSREPADALQLQGELLDGRWQLTRGQFEFYHAEAVRMSGRETPVGERTGLTEAAVAAWEEWQRAPGTRGQRTSWFDGRPWFTIGRSTAARQAVLIQSPESLLSTLPAERGVVCAWLDSEGRPVAGTRRPGNGVMRLAAESQLPWSLIVADNRGPTDALLARQRLMIVGMATMVVFLMAGAYFIARAIRREVAVSQLQTDFVNAVSHEFRSPLTAMRQMSEILAFGRVPNEEKRQKFYDTLLGETQRLQRLVETLLNFNKLEAGARQFRLEVIDAGRFVEDVVAGLEPQVTASGRRIELTRTAGPAPIKADAEALALAVSNLIDNALKYSPGQPAIWVECGRDADVVAIRVRDAGIGIPTAEQQAIFEKFVRGSAAVAAQVKGTGVGLSMVRHIVRAHGGRIRVQSTPGEGSTFTIELPADRDRGSGVRGQGSGPRSPTPDP
jgi:signal transduction histidine kinase